MTEHVIWVKSFILPYIKNGSKTLEVRLSSRMMKRIQVGDTLLFNEEERRKVKDIRHRKDFHDVVTREDTEKILPGYGPARLHALYMQHFGALRDLDGVLVFEIEPVS